jgi:hypothetical protein
MSTRPELASRLAALDARVWAQLLRALRVLVTEPGEIADALAHPTGELASGPARRALCDVLAVSDGILAELRDDTTLPAAVHLAITVDDAQEDQGAGTEDAANIPPNGTERATERARALRRELEEERRKREGADARAVSAETRAGAAEEERDALRAQVAELEAGVVAAREAVERSVARVERRSSSRVEALEQELTSERSAHEVSRRDLERARVELAEVRSELAEIRSHADAAMGAQGVSGAVGASERPLVLPPAMDASTTDAARWFAARVRLLLVDGYNVALQLRPGRPLEDQRRWLVERLRPLVVRGGPHPVVIFDGDGSSGRMRDTGGVEVRFTARGMIADDEIVFAVAATADPVLVITDDVELGERVRAEGGNVIGVIHLSGIVDG